MKGIELTVILVLFSGCAVGPDFVAPKLPEVKDYTAKPLPEHTVSTDTAVGASQVFINGKGADKEWWKAFNSTDLNKVVAAALKNSPTLAAAQGAVKEARENYNAQYGGVVYPQVTASFSGGRNKTSPAAAMTSSAEGQPFNTHRASLDASYLFDIFGGSRRELEGLKAKVDYQGYKLKAARLTLAANVVAAVVDESALRAQIEAVRSIVLSQEKQMQILRQQFDLGGVANADILMQSARLEEARAVLPPLEKALVVTRHRLAVLTGELPGNCGKLPEFTLSSLTLPKEMPVDVPSNWARYRPDICASTALLHAACAKVGVATADMYPQIVLNAGYGSQVNMLKNILQSNHDIWSIGGAMAEPVIDGGTRRAKRRGAQAAYEQAAAQYKEVLLNAFMNVADTLAALESDAKALNAQAAAERAAYDSYELMQKQFKAGAVSYDAVLNADRQHQQALTGRIKAQAQRLYDSTALFQAMGSGEE